MIDLEPGALVVLCCLNPKEKLWGVMEQLDGRGVIMRGLGLDSVEDWLRQERTKTDAMITASTVFVPIHRIQRIYCDESSEGFVSYGDRFSADCGLPVRDVLRNGRAVASGEDV